MPPHFRQFIEKPLIVLNVAHLTLRLVIPFQSPIWRRGHYQMDTSLFQKVQLAGVFKIESVAGRDALNCRFNLGDSFEVLR
jgi:hypothetical protein